MSVVKQQGGNMRQEAPACTTTWSSIGAVVQVDSSSNTALSKQVAAGSDRVRMVNGLAKQVV